MRLALYVRSALDFVGRSDYRNLMSRVGRALYSETAGVEVRRDLTSKPVATDRERQPRIRPATVADLLALLAPSQEADMDADELWQRRLRRHVMDAIGVEGCFVADVEERGPSFMQYLFTAGDNDRLQARFSGLFPVLTADEALVEFLYVAPDARSPGVAVNCLVQVAAEAQRRGASSVISYIDPSNKGALFVNHLAGFRAYSVRRSRKRLLRSSYTFEAWPADTSRALSDLASGKATIS